MAVPGKMDLKQCVIKFRDATPVTPKTITLKIDDGDIQWTMSQAREYIMDRGLIDTVRNGDEAPMTVSIDVRYSNISSTAADPASVFEVLTKTGEAASWVSTGANCEPYAVDLIVERDNSGCVTATQDEDYVFPDFRWDQIQGSFKDGKLTISGSCNATKPVATRS